MIIRRAGRDRPVHMLEAVGLDPSPRFEDTDVPEVGVFGCDAADIFTHAANDVRDLALGQPGRARLILSCARLEMPRRGPIRRPKAPPIADAQSSGSTAKAANNSPAPQASRRWTSRGALAPRLDRLASTAIDQGADEPS